LFCPGDEEDCLDGQDFYRSRVPIANDDQCLPPAVRLPEMDSFRFLRSVTGFSSGTPVAPMATSEEIWVVADESRMARPTVRFPGYRHEERSPDLKDILVPDTVISASLSFKTDKQDESRKNQMADSISVMPTLENISSCQEKLPNELPDELNGEETGRPHVRLPRVNGFRPHRIDKDNFSIRIPQAPMIFSKKDWIDVDEDVATRSTVRFPGHSARQELDEPSLNDLNEDTEEIDKKWSCSCLLFVDPVEETCLAEMAWNEELGDCKNESHDSQISVDSGIDRNSDICNDISDGKQNGLNGLAREVSQIVEFNIPGTESTNMLDDSNYERDKLDAQIEIVSQSCMPPVYKPISLSLFVIGYDGNLYNNCYFSLPTTTRHGRVQTGLSDHRVIQHLTTIITG
jgi:hypothetical protein